MAAIEKKILDTFRKTIPQLSDLDKEKLLAFGEGMAFKSEQQRRDCSKINVEVTAVSSKDPPEKDSA